jgi:hypothetical protein
MKITLPNGTILEMDDTPSGVNKQVEVPQADDLVEQSASSGDPVATEKRGGQTTSEPKPAAKPAPAPPGKSERAPIIAKEQPAAAEVAPAPLPAPLRGEAPLPASGNLLDHQNPNVINDPQRNNPNVFHFVAPREE